MKIRELLKNLNPYTYIKILEYVGSEDYEILWEGEAYNCPWRIAEEADNTDYIIGEGIFLDIVDTKKDKIPCLCIYSKKVIR